MPGPGISVPTASVGLHSHFEPHRHSSSPFLRAKNDAGAQRGSAKWVWSSTRRWRRFGGAISGPRAESVELVMRQGSTRTRPAAER